MRKISYSGQHSFIPCNSDIERLPTWAISKGVARKNQESIKAKAQSEEHPNGEFQRDGNEVSKRK